MTSQTSDRQWMSEAACRGLDADIFHPVGSSNNRFDQAIRICHGCPVVTECRDWALQSPSEIHGVHGALTPIQLNAARTGAGKLRHCARCDTPFRSHGARLHCSTACWEQARKPAHNQTRRRQPTGATA